MPKNLPTIKVQGGQSYVMVKDRVIGFHELHPNGSIETEIIKNDEQGVLFKATVYPDANDRNRRFTGHSESFSNSKGVEGQKPVEVCETSAIGRALAALGIGVIESYASADEVATAPTTGRSLIKQKYLASQKQIDYIKSLIQQKGKPMPDDDWFSNLDSDTAKRSIDKLLKTFPTREQGDFTPDHEGDKSDYNPETGELLK